MLTKFANGIRKKRGGNAVAAKEPLTYNKQGEAMPSHSFARSLAKRKVEPYESVCRADGWKNLK